MKRSNKSMCRPSLETLERRQLMAGDVAVALEGSLLTVQGDALNNQIAISSNVAGDVVVSGQNGTLINGLASVRFPRVALNAVEVRMEGGNDIVTMRSLQVANDLFVDLGNGDDRLTMPATAPSVIGGNLLAYGSEGADTFQLNNVAVREDAFVDGGIGLLNYSMNNATIDKVMTIIGDEANDSVTMNNTSIGLELHVETKGGSDRVTLSGVSSLGMTINTDSNAAAGIDLVTLNQVTTVEDLNVFTGSGNDTVRMTDVTSGKSMTVSLDEGNDRIIATRVHAALDLVFEGGAGLDTLEDYGISAGVKREFKEFETFR